MSNDHLRSAVEILRMQLAAVERQRAPRTAGPRGGAAERAAQVERFRARLAEAERKLAEAEANLPTKGNSNVC